MTLDTRPRTPNGAHLAPLYPPVLDDRLHDEVSIRSLCATIDRLTQLVERMLEREIAPAAQPAPARLIALTARELEVARLVVEGKSSKEIQRRLVLSDSTVNSHRRNISRKLGTSSRAGLTAIRAEWEVEAAAPA